MGGEGAKKAEKEEGEDEGCGHDDDDAFPPLKRRKVHQRPQPISSQGLQKIGSSPINTEIKLSTRSGESYPLPAHLQETENESPSTYTHITDFARRQGTFPSDDSCPSLDHLHDTELGLSSTRPQIEVLSHPQGMLPPYEPYPFHAHHIPHDLIISNIVASRLPLHDLIRARTVCRAWRDSIFSPIIAESFLANPDCSRSRLLVEHSSPSGASLAAYDPYVNKWSVVPIPSFGRLVAASRGLFCYVTEAGRPPSLVVGNPVINQWKHLPAIPLCVPAHGPQIVAMLVNTSTGSYKVTVLFGTWDCDATDAYLPFMFNSVSGKWTRMSIVSARLSFAASRSVVNPPDMLLSVDSNAINLLWYDMTDNVGGTMQVQRLPFLINEEDPKTNLWRRLPQIAVCEGLLFLVARCLGGGAPECKLGQLPIVQHSSVGVWMMQASYENWEFITRVPFDLLEKLVKGSDGTDFIIASNGDRKLFFVLKGSPHMLAYDPILNKWTLLPGCPADYNSYPLHQSAFYEPLLWVRAVQKGKA